MGSREVFELKPPTDTRNTYFDFTGSLAVAETISTQVTTATVFSGVDANPSAIISGAASASGFIVTQKITGGVLGTVYSLLCTITTSAGQTLTRSGYLAILAEATV